MNWGCALRARAYGLLMPVSLRVKTVNEPKTGSINRVRKPSEHHNSKSKIQNS
jgi:hypothetical protein